MTVLSPQTLSDGDSSPEIHSAALAAAHPTLGLRWLDVGCGRGHLLRAVREAHAPTALLGVDLLDWLEEDLRADVDLRLGAAEDVLPHAPTADRVLMIETIEHLEAPWTVLRAAARRVASGGRLVVTTPNVATARHRFELLLRGRLTAFRPDNLTHVTPALPHVLARVLEEEGLGCTLEYAARDVIPFTGGRRWPRAISTLAPRLTRVSCVVSAQRLPTETRLGDGYEETTASESAAYLVRSCPPADQPT